MISNSQTKYFSENSAALEHFVERLEICDANEGSVRLNGSGREEVVEEVWDKNILQLTSL